MVMIDTQVVFALWQAKEAREQRRITIQEVVKGAKINTQSVNGLRKGTITRLDTGVVDRFCAFFDVPPGPVPFLIYTPDQNPS